MGLGIALLCHLRSQTSQVRCENRGSGFPPLATPDFGPVTCRMLCFQFWALPELGNSWSPPASQPVNCSPLPLTGYGGRDNLVRLSCSVCENNSLGACPVAQRAPHWGVARQINDSAVHCWSPGLRAGCATVPSCSPCY